MQVDSSKKLHRNEKRRTSDLMSISVTFWSLSKYGENFLSKRHGYDPVQIVVGVGVAGVAIPRPSESVGCEILPPWIMLGVSVVFVGITSNLVAVSDMASVHCSSSYLSKSPMGEGLPRLIRDEGI